MSCDWSSYKIRDIQSAADDAKKNAAEALRETRALKEQFERVQRDQREIMQNQQRILQALDRLSGEVKAMHDELYPKAENTKPALKAPGA